MIFSEPIDLQAQRTELLRGREERFFRGQYYALRRPGGRSDSAIAVVGQQFGEPVGLQNNINRWYDPKVASWTSQALTGLGETNAQLLYDEMPPLILPLDAIFDGPPA